MNADEGLSRELETKSDDILDRSIDTVTVKALRDGLLEAAEQLTRTLDFVAKLESK